MNILILNRSALLNRPYRQWLGDEHRLTLLTDARSVSAAPELREEQLGAYDHTVVYESFHDNSDVELEVLRLHRKEPFDALVALGEFDLLRTARLRGLLGLPGQSVASAEAFRDKLAMKDLLDAAGVPVTRYAAVSHTTDLLRFAETHGYPIVVKPRRGAGSVGVTVLRDDDETARYITESPLLGRDDDAQLLAEVYLDHELFHVDGIVVDGTPLLVWPSSHGDQSCLSPLQGVPLSSTMLEADDPRTGPLRELTLAALGALPLPGTSMFHAEVFGTPGQGLVFNEVGCRMGGGRIEESLIQGFGISLPEVYVKASAGRPHPAVPAAPEHTGGFVLFPPRPGRLVSRPTECDVPGVVNFRVNAEPGTVLNAAGQSTDAYASALIRAADRAQALQAVERLTAWVAAETVIEPARETPTRLVLWDLDHTLLHPAGFGQTAMKAAFERLFGTAAPTGIPASGRTDRAILKDYLEQGAPDSLHYQDALQGLACALAEERAGTFTANGGHALPGALSAVAALAEQSGVIQSVLTGNLRRIGQIKLDAIGLGSGGLDAAATGARLDVSVAAFGDDHLVRAELLDLARDRAERSYGTTFKGQQVVVVGDTPLDVEAAHARGALAVAVATGAYTADQLAEAGADLVLADLREVSALVAAVTR
ncbi:biotin carboxylase/phosphoglycolate phosphatase-like HAD superfamily hydrolase [Streptacidiphilus sp. MAP12-33]|uniref:haloacid dehalogenase-like hydrolase n=1 Tax=Streptacidiphilus sp. MAP12-33 TaxID=3156266 RepID=UPI003518B105